MKNLYLTILLALISISISAQNQKVWILISPSQENAANGNDSTSISAILNEYSISAQRAFPYSRNDTLKRLYEIDYNERLIPLLEKNANIESVFLQEDVSQIELYEPSDYFWNTSNPNGSNRMWHLRKIQADSAWEITKGDSTIKVAILDTWFDINHPDLTNQLIYHYDPYDNQPFYSRTWGNHGTTVASFVAARNDGGGHLVSIGFNCKIIPYKHGGNAMIFLQRAQHAAFVEHADVITSSAGGWTCPRGLIFSTIEQIAVREILDNGVVIVMPAGNEAGTHCEDTINNIHQPWRPMHPFYDERIIIVTSTGINDNHSYFRGNEDCTHSHYPYVDICAPGYETMGAIGTLKEDGSPNTSPYYPDCNGTSFSTPIVAGV